MNIEVLNVLKEFLRDDESRLQSEERIRKMFIDCGKCLDFIYVSDKYI